MPLIRCGEVLAVQCEVSTYVLEPIRFGLGFSLLEMLDDHLATLTANRGHGPDVDELLEARQLLERADHDFVVG